MNLKGIGEFGLIDQLSDLIKTDHPDLLVGIGDDAAVIRKSENDVWLVTIDTMVENTHFDLNCFSFHQLGQKLIAVNLSDIAAMGGQPQFALISLAVSEHLSLDSMKEMYRGMKDMASRYQTIVVGGDTTATLGPMVLTCSVIGIAKKEKIRTRSQAISGDIICVTGYPGMAAVGINILKQNDSDNKLKYNECINRHLTPEPRVIEARFLIEHGDIHSLIDVSDGISSDLHHICQMSSVGAIIFERDLPIHSCVFNMENRKDRNCLHWVLNGGEDFELLMTMGENNFSDFKHTFEAKFNLPLTKIGEILPAEEGIKIKRNSGKVEQLKPEGYKHFC